MAMVWPLELRDLLAVIRLTRGSAQAIGSDVIGLGKAREDHVSRSGWVWSSKSIFKKQRAKVQSRLPCRQQINLPVSLASEGILTHRDHQFV